MSYPTSDPFLRDDWNEMVSLTAADQGRVMQEQMTGGPMPTDPGKAFEVRLTPFSFDFML